MTARVLKWDVPVDDQVHYVGTGKIVHIACQSTPDVVQVWTVEDDDARPYRAVRVVGTGHPFSWSWDVWGSTVAASGALVWHLLVAPPDMWGRS